MTPKPPTSPSSHSRSWRSSRGADKRLYQQYEIAYRERERREEYYRGHFQEWLTEQVITLDEATKQQLRWPDLGYLRDVATILKEERLIAIPKSRRVMATWGVAMHTLHEASLRPNVEVLWLSRTETTAAATVDKKVWFAHQHLVDKRLRRKVRSYRTSSGDVGKIVFDRPEGSSEILALASGADVVKSYTASIVVFDESEFQNAADAAFRGIMPLFEEGKDVQIIVLSSSNGPNGILARMCARVGFTRFMCCGGPASARLVELPIPTEAPPAAKGYEGRLEVLRVLRGPGGWAIVPIHYCANPAHDRAWRERERERYQKEQDWEIEMEFNTSVTSGPRAYWAYVPQVHRVRNFELQAELPARLACDWNVSPCIWSLCQVVPIDLVPTLLVVHQVKMDPATTPGMCEKLHELLGAHRAGLWIYGDAAGHGRNPQTGESNYQLLLRNLMWYPGEVKQLVPRDNPAIIDRLNWTNAKLLDEYGRPGILVAERCEEVLADLSGCETDTEGKLRKSTNPADPYSKRGHAMDGVGYLVAWEWPEINVGDQGSGSAAGGPEVDEPGRPLGALPT